MDEATLHSKISNKHYSPLVIRRYATDFGVMFVGIISDDDLNRLDEIILPVVKKSVVKTIEEARTLTGKVCEMLKITFTKVEGVAVVSYFDKLMVSSLWGDFMNHESCRIELYELINVMTKV